MRKFAEGLSGNAELKNIVASNVSKNLELQRRRDARAYHYDGDDYHHEKGNALPPPGANEEYLQKIDFKRHAERDSSVWVLPGDTVRIGKYTIRGGFFYLGHDLLCPDMGRYVDEPSLVDPELEYTRSQERPGHCVCCTENYIYGYSGLSPHEKALYLEWLAGERNDSECPGYVYIYFCGIERRLLVDNRMGMVSRAEFMLLVEELKRLETVYGDCLEKIGGSVNDLLSYAIMTNKHSDHGHTDTQIIKANLHLPGLFKFPLAVCSATGRPISPEVALAWVRNHPDYAPGTLSGNQEEEFDDLFLLGYEKIFGEGLRTRPPSTKTDLSISCDPANDSLCRIEATFNLPEANGLGNSFKKLKKLAETCMEELSFNHGSANYKSRASIPASDRIKIAMKNNVSGSAELVPVQSLLGYAGESVPRQISSKQALMISEIAQGERLAIAPDIRFHDARPRIDGNLVLLPGGTGEDFTPSEAFKKMIAVLRLGSMILSGDEDMKGPGTDLLRGEIDGNALLAEAEKHSLHAYLLWRIQAPRSESGLKNYISGTLNTAEKTAAGRLAVRTAAVAGALSPSAIRRIEKIYALLGLEKGAVSADIHNQLSPERNFARADVASGARTGAESRRGLDSDLINSYEKETRSVRAVLENVFEDGENPEDLAVNGTMPDSAPPGGTVSGLDEKNRLLYERLVAKRQWSPEEVRKLCGDMELMVDGSIETINDWAFETAGAPLIDFGHRVFIDQEVAETINAL